MIQTIRENVYVVFVEDELSLEERYPGYRQRFSFDEADEADQCRRLAEEAGFRARIEKVARTRLQRVAAVSR